MEKGQLISMIHFLVKREDERAQENQELKDMVKELRDTHKQDVKTQTNLQKSIDKLTSQVADLTTLKGQGNSLMYPVPECRTPGDIDIWVFGDRKDITRFVKERTPNVFEQYHHIDFPNI